LSLVVECSILVELVVCGGFAQKLVVHGGKKVITPKFYRIIWYTSTYMITAMCLKLYRFPQWSKRFIFMFDIGSNECFVMGAPYTDGVMVTVSLVKWATRGRTRSGCWYKTVCGNI
jgi:hypothetical protein